MSVTFISNHNADYAVFILDQIINGDNLTACHDTAVAFNQNYMTWPPKMLENKGNTLKTSLVGMNVDTVAPKAQYLSIVEKMNKRDRQTCNFSKA